jgi:hypothetical protein
MTPPDARRRTKTLLVPALFIIVYIFLWNAPAVALRDPWYVAYAQVTRGLSAKDPVAKQHLIDKGGEGLRSLVAQYPQHARVRYLLARYYFYTGNYDSAAVQAQQAIRLGSGAEVDQVDGLAQDLLDAAKAKKAMLDTNESGGRK